MPRLSFALSVLGFVALACGTPAGHAEEAKGDQQVLRHAVFFGFKDGTSKQDLQKVVDAFRALPNKIEAIREFQWGERINRPKTADGLTHGFLLTFADDEGRAAYLPHPDHKAFGGVLRPHLERVFVIDYWGQPQQKQPRHPLKHAVFVRFKKGASPESVAKIEKAFAALPERIDAIHSFEWGTNNSPETHDQGFTHCFMLTFESKEDLASYDKHPAHVAFAKDLLANAETVRVIDFVTENVPTQASR